MLSLTHPHSAIRADETELSPGYGPHLNRQGPGPTETAFQQHILARKTPKGLHGDRGITPQPAVAASGPALIGNQKRPTDVIRVLPYQKETSRCLTNTRLRAQQPLRRARTLIARMCASKSRPRLRLRQHLPNRALAPECLLLRCSWSSRSLQRRFSATVTRLAPVQVLPHRVLRLKTMWPLQTPLPLQKSFPHQLPHSLFRRPKLSILSCQCQTQVLRSRLSLRLRSTLNQSSTFTSLTNGGHPLVAAIFMSGGLPC